MICYFAVGGYQPNGRRRSVFTWDRRYIVNRSFVRGRTQVHGSTPENFNNQQTGSQAHQLSTTRRVFEARRRCSGSKPPHKCGPRIIYNLYYIYTTPARISNHPWFHHDKETFQGGTLTQHVNNRDYGPSQGLVRISLTIVIDLGGLLTIISPLAGPDFGSYTSNPGIHPSWI